MAAYTPMIQQYLSIKEGVQDAFLFFRLGDFYELFFDDAILASRELEITLTGRDGGSAEKIPMCGVPYHAADNYIARLIEKGYKVAICEQVEDPSVAKGIVRREVVRTITPGTVMESKSLDGKQNNFIAAVVEQDGLFGLASSDLSTGEIYVTSFVGRIDSLMDEVNIYAPAELVGDQPLLTQLEQSNNWSKKVPLTPWEACTEEMLAEQFSSEQLIEINGARRKAVRVLLSYLEDTQKRNLSHLKILHNYEPNQYMILDYHTRRNLELTETVRDRSKKGSLLWLLDRTQTAMGARLLRRWIDKPLLSAKGIVQRQSAVETLYLNMILREDIRRELAPIYDLERLVGRVAYGNANAKDVHALKLSLRRVPALMQLCEQSNSNVLQQLVKSVDPCDDLADLIDTVLIDDPPLSLREGGLIRDGYDDYLDQLREASKNGKVWLAELERKEREATGIRTLKIGFNKVFGYYLEISKANVANLPEGRYERKQTLANAERYVTPELKEKERLILEAEEKMVDLEYSKFIELREHLLEHLPRLQKVAAMIAELDVYQSFALVSAELRFVKPTITEQYDLHIVEGRHPVVEVMMESSSFIANATDLYRDEHSILLITGPNMAGKSTYMRQVALICIMAQIGCFVPAQSATIPLTDRIFTRIGAADDLIGGQSTFMVEMKDIQMMTEQATLSSLVIIDELGRGTSTGEGMAIAQAVIEYVHEHIGCKALVSTHFHELSHLSTSLTSLVNARMAVEESGDHVTFLRKLVPGAADTSYGIYCAQLAGLPDSIITRAYQLLDEDEQVETQMISKAAAPAKALHVSAPISIAEANQSSGQADTIAISSDAVEIAHIVAESARAIAQIQAASEISYDTAQSVIAIEEPVEITHAELATDVVQLSIFGETAIEAVKPKLSSAEEQVVKQLKKLDLFNMTPMQAMTVLNELKTKLH